ncbi:TonB-dependent receptor [Sphingomonas rhizophila]|uniref:TonB-dependent receptor n=1 Tax=Sphingomonas rhizophila TaxID=2071607 RepID=UPI001FE7FC8F|nr:TonB-dependent receptor [Sphingomonas rhizophila]
MTIRRIHHAALLASAATFIIATPAWAQTAEEQQAQASNEISDEPETVIVTATKRASTVQDVPFSINAQTQEDIQRANALSIEDISRNVAGLAVQNLGPGQSQVSIRGVSAGQIVRDQPGVKEQVGVYLDESVISLSLFTPDIDLYDLNRVETLRGPQGTLFGSGSVGGTLRYITNQPRLDRIEGSVEANVNSVEEDDIGYHLKGAINLPVSDTVAIRAVGYGTKFAGFVDSVGPYSRKNVNDGSRVGGRLSVLFDPGTGVKLTPRVVYQKVKANGFNRQEFFNLYANPLTTTRPAYTFGEREQYLLVGERFVDETLLTDVTASIEVGDSAEITSVTSYINRDLLVSRDASALTGSISDDFGFDDLTVLLPSNLVDTTDLRQFSQELRVASTNASPFQWLIGVFYSSVDRDYSQTLPTPGYADRTGGPAGGSSNPDSPYNSYLAYDISQAAIFGEASYDFGDVKATLGGRYYDFAEDRTLFNEGLFVGPANSLKQKTKSDGFSPRAILTYEPSNNLSFNVQAAKGFRLGGSNDPLNLPLCDNGEPNGPDAQLFGPFSGAYRDETLWNYEAGFKYSRRGVTFNAAAFYTKIKDLQVTLDAGTCSSRLVFNVDKAHTKGVEAEFSIRPVSGLEFSFSGSLVESEFDSTLPGALAVSTGIRDGNRLPSVPKYQFAAAANYGQRFGGMDAEWYVNGSFQRVGNRYTQPADQENNPRLFVYGNDFGGIPDDVGTLVDLKLPAYSLTNLSAGVKWDNGLEISAYVNNLFDKNPLLSFDRERGGRARLGYNIGTPRTIGLTIRKSFSSLRAQPVEVAPPPPPPPPQDVPASQTCADGSVILATDVCPAPPPPPAPPPAGERGL